MTKKPYKFPHFGKVNNRHTFAQAYREISRNRNKVYKTAGSQSPFVPVSTVAQSGKHKGEKVIIFKTTDGNERARTYACCWGHVTNCNRTYIDRFSRII